MTAGSAFRLIVGGIGQYSQKSRACWTVRAVLFPIFVRDSYSGHGSWVQRDVPSVPRRSIAIPLEWKLAGLTISGLPIQPQDLNPELGRVRWPKKGKRKRKVETVFLVCEETGDHNYTIRRKTGGEKLKLSKFSPRLRKHTLHVEKKK